MKNDLFASASDGFFGSFKLAAMIVAAIVAVFYGFVNGEAMPSTQGPDKTSF